MESSWVTKAQILSILNRDEESKKCFTMAFRINPEYVLRFIKATKQGRNMVYESGMEAKEK